MNRSESYQWERERLAGLIDSEEREGNTLGERGMRECEEKP